MDEQNTVFEILANRCQDRLSSTAELQVLGTQFNVDVKPSVTELYVNEG